jgi:hypothetical protein
MRTLPLLALLSALACADDPATPARIQYYGTWAQAKAEAARLQRPILLLSAAPQCHGVSGIW